MTAARLAVAVAACVAACSSPARPVAPIDAPLEIPRLEGGASRPPPSDGVRFGRVPPAVGARWIVSVEAQSHASDPQGGEQVSTYRSEYEVEVLGIEGGAPSRVGLRFRRNEHAYQGAAKPTVLDGRSYVVDAAPPHVRDASGSAASEEETRRVLDVFPDLGTRARVDEVLPDGAMEIGERRDELAGAVLRVIHPRAWTLEAGSATLSRVDGEVAVFALSLDASSEGGIRMKVEGEARVRLRDARLAVLALDGTYEHGPGTSGAFSLRRSVREAP